ncbi:MAG: response regulator [Planctomycetales bacterium]|nr:response regulator [Planctomycetales bacterium]
MSSETCTVCVIDDDSSVRHSLVALLQCFDIDVLAFESAEHYLAANVVQRIVFFVLDYRLPGMTGIQLLDHLREAGWEGAAAIVSGNVDINQLENMNVNESVHFLTKPSDPNRLIEIISSELALRCGKPSTP